MHIFLAILGIIGRVVGILILIVLLLLLAVLLIPLRYRMQGEKTDGHAPKGSFRVSWLFRLICIEGKLEEDRSVLVTVKAAGFVLKRIRRGGKGPGAPDEEKGNLPGSGEIRSKDGSGNADAVSGSLPDLSNRGQTDEQTAQPREERRREENAASGQGTLSGVERRREPSGQTGTYGASYSSTREQSREKDSETDGKKQQTPSRKKSRKKDRALSETNRKSSSGTSGQAGKNVPGAGATLMQKLCERISSGMLKLWDLFYDMQDRADEAERKLNRIMKKASYWLTMKNVSALRFVLRRLVILIRHYMPRVMKGYLRYGLWRPDLTGMLTGLIEYLLPAGSAGYDRKPDYYNLCFETDTCAAGHVRLVHAVIMAIRVLLNKECRSLLLSVLRMRKGGKNG